MYNKTTWNILCEGAVDGHLSDLDEYNNPWSSREIFCFSCIMVIAVIMMIYLLRKEKMNKLQAAAILAELVFLGIVFGSTVFTRMGSVRQCELIPFWSWSAILRYHDMELLKENLLNCILLLPAGALLPLIMNRKVKWQEALVFGVLISATIETSQLITMRGLFEWDDMIHNGLGCMVGAVLVNWMIWIFWKKGRKINFPLLPHRVVAGTFFFIY